ncbi:hypothetical protein ACPUEN_15015 [Algoriphagus yeomjeoni]|uniref:hypothetical protein n=1 Tax=Algoriphagus yeomjeoni TaxID=291403 RepID=UPI003CE4D592
MPYRQKTDEILSPELIRILKIFGLVSIGLVFILSFFNTKRANNTGDDLTFRMSSSSRLYFLNVRAIRYDRETRSDAGMLLFRHESRTVSKTDPLLNLVLIFNSRKDEAYLYLEPVNMDWPLELRVIHEGETQDILLENGNNTQFLAQVRQLEPWIKADADFEVKVDSAWVSIWDDPKEREALQATLGDYFRLINGRE